MAIAIPTLLRVLPLLSVVLSEAPVDARAERVMAKLHVSAEVVVTCRLEASVPRVGTPGRTSGSASFSVTCTQGAAAVAAACDGSCSPGAVEGARREYRVTELRGDGTTVATVFF